MHLRISAGQARHPLTPHYGVHAESQTWTARNRRGAFPGGGEQTARQSAIHQGLAASADAGTAGRLQAQMDSISSREERAIHSNVATASCKQSVAAAAKCKLRDASIVFGTFQTVIRDETEFQADLSSADRLEVEGPAVLAFGSALGGAVLGWMLTQLLGSDFRGPRRRAPKPSPLDRPAQP